MFGTAVDTVTLRSFALGVSMSSSVLAAAGKSNSRGAQTFTRSHTSVHLTDALMRVAQSIWIRKPVANLIAKTGVSERQAKYLLARKRGISAEALVSLLRSEDGLQFLEAMMGEARPYWWKAFKRKQRRAALRDEMKRLQHEFDLADAAD